MKLYTDVFSGTEVLSDSYKITLEYEGVIGKIKARMVVKQEGDVDIGRGNEFKGGEEDEQSKDPSITRVIDIVDGFNFQETSFDKAGFEAYFKGYMKKILGHLKANKADRVESFMAGARKFFDWIKQNFEDFSFYTPSDYDTDNIIIMSYYEGEDEAPTFLFTMDGLKETKV
jgi:hypothetical protein